MSSCTFAASRRGSFTPDSRLSSADDPVLVLWEKNRRKPLVWKQWRSWTLWPQSSSADVPNFMFTSQSEVSLWIQAQTSQLWLPVICDLVFRTWSSGSGLRDLVFGTWSLGPGLRDLVFRTWTVRSVDTQSVCWLPWQHVDCEGSVQPQLLWACAGSYPQCICRGGAEVRPWRMM